MNEDEDLELLALQRRLDDAFETTRPRRGFEDELWLRIQSRRPAWSRLADAWAGLVAAIREVPAVPAAAVAAVLIVLIGAGALTLDALRSNRGATPSSGTFGASQASQKYNGAAPQAGGGPFGLLPSPVLRESAGNPADLAGPNETTPPAMAASQPADLYFGPANLTWSGQLNIPFTQAPVYRYQEPTAADANEFATRLGASSQQGHGAPGYLGTYTADGFTVSVRGSIQAPPSEPFYVLTVSPSASVPGGSDPVAVAHKYLELHTLLPTWPYATTVESSGSNVQVDFLRQFEMPGGPTAYLVDGAGDRYGLVVDIKSGRTDRVAGPLPISSASADYPIISVDQAVRSALASGPSGSVSIPPPTVKLTSAELVYTLVWAGDHSFYEPAYLFSGTFDYNGTTYTKRVLVPAVEPAYRSS
jgi:hypothetical protein